MEELITLVNSGDWKKARLIADNLKSLGECSDTFYILESSIYQAEENNAGRFSSLTEGLRKNPYNYELYYMLGEYYSETNLDQGILCMEQALLYCKKEEDVTFINSRINNLLTLGGVRHNLSFIIYVSSKNDLLKLCINSIKKTLPNHSYEIIVVVNDNCTESLELLASIEDIKIVPYASNTNYGKACNLGISAANENYDIMLLHSDTIITPNSILWLKIGAYQEESIGSAGCVTNTCDNNQIILESFSSVNEYIDYSHRINLPAVNPYENKVLLADFGILIKKSALQKVGSIPEDYDQNLLELSDLGINLSSQGIKNILCHNSFIFHFGTCDKDIYNIGLNSSKEISLKSFKNKWGFNIKYYANSRDDIIELMNIKENDCANILEIGCGCGSTLSKIKYLYPNSTVYGLELMENVAALGSNMGNIISGNIETIELPYQLNSLDYILFGDVLEHLHDPSAVISKLKSYLKPNGKIIASIPNLMHYSVIIPLLQGSFTYTDEGLLDRTHIHFFTQKEIYKLFEENGYKVVHMYSRTCEEFHKLRNENQELMNALYALPNISNPIEFETFQYFVVASV